MEKDNALFIRKNSLPKKPSDNCFHCTSQHSCPQALGTELALTGVSVQLFQSLRWRKQRTGMGKGVTFANQRSLPPTGTLRG